MKKKCPKCGSKKIKGQKVCPDCGFSLEKNDQHIQNERDVVEATDKSLEQIPEENNQSDFPDTELNDPIEWSELKDLPLESVMELFDASETPEETMEKETTGEQVEEKKEKTVKPMKKNQDKQPENQKESKAKQELSIDETVEKEKQERIAQLKENVEKEDNQSILAAYIQAHREDVDEEQSKELMKMIHEKIAADQAPEIAEDVAAIKEENSTDTEAVVSDSAKSDDEKEKKIERQEELATKEKSFEPVVEERESKADEAEKTVEKVTEEPTAVFQKQSAKDESSKIDKKTASKAVPVQVKKEKMSSQKKDDAVKQPTKETVEQMTEKSKKSVIISTTEKEAVQKESEKSTSETEQPTGKTKKAKKGPYLLLAAVILLGVGGWAYYDNQQKVEAERIAEVARQEKQVSEIKQELTSFYVGDTNEFIRTDHLNQDLSKIKQELKEVESTKDYQEVNETYNDIQEKIISIKKVNDLFTEPVIEDDHLVEQPILKNTDKIEAIEVDDSAFGELIQKAQQEAQKQLEQIETAKEKTKVVYQDEKVVDSATRDQYKAAKEAVDKIANKELAEPFKQQLTKVDHQLAEKEKQAAEKKAAEEKAKQEAEQKAKAEQAAAAQAEKAAQESAKASTASSTTTVGSGSTANQPIMGTNASDVADSSNAAWNWASGVRESVIATCIQRGYIVEGGYKLEKAQIKNGEGYYNLYATSTKSSLMNGIGESALPFYIVTINCKTGWFGGNGSN